jgi:hypothetical protein
MKMGQMMEYLLAKMKANQEKTQAMVKNQP